MKALRLVSWLIGALGLSFAGIQVAALVLAFTLGRVGACKPIIESDGKAKHGLALDVGLHEPNNDLDELWGATLHNVRPGEKEGCFAEWTDEEPIMMLDSDGPKNGTEFVFWKAFTLHGKTSLGRYVADLWTGVSIGSGGALNSRSSWSKAGNIRLVERIPPPQPAPPGFRSILPGECVFGSLEAKEDRVVGRFWIELPAPRNVRLFTQLPTEIDARLQERLTFDDLDVPEDIEVVGSDSAIERRPTDRLVVRHSGFHKVIIYRVDPLGAPPAEKVRNRRYTLQVYWGRNLSYGCSPNIKINESCF